MGYHWYWKFHGMKVDTENSLYNLTIGQTNWFDCSPTTMYDKHFTFIMYNNCLKINKWSQARKVLLFSLFIDICTIIIWYYINNNFTTWLAIKLLMMSRTHKDELWISLFLSPNSIASFPTVGESTSICINWGDPSHQFKLNSLNIDCSIYYLYVIFIFYFKFLTSLTLYNLQNSSSIAIIISTWSKLSNPKSFIKWYFFHR